jgi:hypothetical protein
MRVHPSRAVRPDGTVSDKRWTGRPSIEASTILLAAALLTCVALVAPTASLASSSDEKLKGTFASGGSVECLTAPSGFNSDNQPNDPASSYITSSGTYTVRTYDGTGKGTLQATVVTVSYLAAAANSSQLPAASTTTVTGNFTYTVDSSGAVTITEPNEQGTILSGPRAGQTYIVNQYQLAGTLAQNGRALALATPKDEIETITYSNGESDERICHRSGTSVQVTP